MWRQMGTPTLCVTDHRSAASNVCTHTLTWLALCELSFLGLLSKSSLNQNKSEEKKTSYLLLLLLCKYSSDVTKGSSSL